MININGSKLRITQLNFSRGDSVILGIDKKSLRYQRVLFTSPMSSAATVLPIPTSDLSIPNQIKRAGYSEAWVIEKTDTKYTKEKYDGLEKDVMLKWAVKLFPEKLDTAEILVRAVDYGNVTRKFYESYGTDLIREFYNLVGMILDGAVKPTGRSDKKYAPQYIAPKYSILNLMKDIMEAKDVQIYTDPDLIGKYKRISRGLKLTGEIVPDKWCKVIGLVGNRTRANLSLSYQTLINITIPENEFGVKAETRELKTNRSFCIVKDGVVWSKWLGVKTKNTTLVRKMTKAGIIKSSIVYSDEYLLNLESLPAISASEIRHISSTQMAKAEAAVVLDKIGSAWARRKDYMEKKSLTVCPKLPQPVLSDADKFLHSIGIYGDTYLPVKSEAAEVTKTYETYEVVGQVYGMSDPSSIAMRYINGKLEDGPTKAWIEKVEERHSKSGLSWEQEIKYWEDKMSNDIHRLRELKYRFILGKTLKFCDQRNTKVENVRVDLPVGMTMNKLVVSWKMIKNRVEV